MCVKVFFTFVFVLLLTVCNGGKVEAKVQTIEGVGCVICGNDIAEDENRAIEVAKQNVIEKSGYYVRSFSKVENYELKEDEIIPVANKIISITATKISREYDVNGVKIVKVLVTATFDDEYLLDLQRKDIEKILQDYNSLKEKYDSEYTQKKITKTVLDSYVSYEEGNSKLFAGKFNEAIEQYKKALLLNPTLKEAHIGLGNVYLHLTDYQLALSEFGIALEEDNKSLPAYVGRAKVYEQLGNTKKAIINYNIALMLNDKNVNALCGRARCYMREKNYEKANVDFERASFLENKDRSEE